MKTARLILMLLLALMVSAQAGAQDEDTVADTLQAVEAPSDELQVQVNRRQRRVAGLANKGAWRTYVGERWC